MAERQIPLPSFMKEIKTRADSFTRRFELIADTGILPGPECPLQFPEGCSAIDAAPFGALASAINRQSLSRLFYSDINDLATRCTECKDTLAELIEMTKE